MVLPKRTPSWIMCTDGRLSACRPHEELLFKRPPYKYVRSSPTVLFMILARKRFRAFFLMFLVFWCVGGLAFWRSGSGGDEKLCAVDVKKTCNKGGDARYFKCAEIAFFEDKNRKRTGETTKGRACEPINV